MIYYTTNKKTRKTHLTEDLSDMITQVACTDIAVTCTTHKFFPGFHFPEISLEKCLSMIEVGSCQGTELELLMGKMVSQPKGEHNARRSTLSHFSSKNLLSPMSVLKGLAVSQVHMICDVRRDFLMDEWLNNPSQHVPTLDSREHD